MNTTATEVDRRKSTAAAGRKRPRRPTAVRLLAVLAVLGLLGAACSAESEDKFEAVGDSIDGAGDYSPNYESPDYDESDGDYLYDDGIRAQALPPTADSPNELIAPTDPSTNEFAPTTINPWVDTNVDAQSTFALDVDTGSYTISRSYLENGSVPPPDAIRVEEIVNFLDYGYADPDDGDFRIELAGSATPFTSEEDDVRLLRVGLQSQRIEDANRRDAALTFVVDTSGSMDLENRLGLVKTSLGLLVEQLRPTDTIALVTFGSSGNVILEPTAVSDRTEILDAIDRLRPGGGTNAEQGVQLGYEQARNGFRQGGINRVIFAGDGMANIGISDPEGLASEVRGYADDGIQLLTLGFGMGNYSDALMERIANEGDGFYAYIDDRREAERLFGEQLVSTLQTLALDAKVQVTFEPSQVSAFRLVGFENRALAHEDFRDDTVDAGDIGAGHAITALYEVRMAPSVDAEASMATIGLRWADPDTGAVTEIDEVLAAGQMTGSFSEAPVSLQRAAVAGYYAEVLRQSPLVTERGVTMAEVDQAAQSVMASGGGDGRFDDLVTLVGRASQLSGGR